MPAHHTHYYFGSLILKNLSKEIQNLINQNDDTKAAFIIGLQGPDILAFYRPIFKNKLNIEGSDIHHNPGYLFFKDAVSQYKRSQNPVSKSYILGSLCHYLLDAACHPIITSYVRKTGMSHALVEREWDAAVLKLQGYTPFGVDVDKIVPITKASSKEISLFYRTATVRNISQALHDMKRSISFLSIKNTYLRKLICKFLSSMKFTKKQVDMVAQDFVDKRSIISSQELQNKFDEILPSSVIEVEYFYKKLKNNESIDFSRYKLDYLGKEH